MKLNIKVFFLCLIALPVLSWGAAPNNFLVITDIHLSQTIPAKSMVINPPKLSAAYDLDSTTFDNFISVLNKNIQNKIVAQPDFIILLGDLAGHNSVPDDTIKSEAYVFNKLKTTFPNTPIFYTFGNNDSLVKDYGTFSREASPKNPYEVAINSQWEDGFLSIGKMCSSTPDKYPCIINKNVDNGFYSAYIQPGLRLISLNSVMFSPKREGVTDAQSSAELTWLSNQLQDASQQTESVLITMHIPPGHQIFNDVKYWKNDSDQTQFIQTIEKYNSSIIGILAGHTHREEFKIITDNGKLITGVYFTAALSTSLGNAPSVKTFYYSNTDGKWQLTSSETFYFTGTNQNPVLNKLYEFKNYYCNNSAVSLFDCVTSVNTNNIPDLMKKYITSGNPNLGDSVKVPDAIMINVK